MDNNANVMTEVTTLMRAWEEDILQPNHNPVPTLTRLAEIIEVETDNYLKMDPDPFDERHPSRTDPDCKLGQILKALFRKETFMNKLVNDYLRETYYSRLGLTGRDVEQLNIAACRLMLDILPGLETSVVFQPDTDGIIYRLNKWATDAVEPLQSYATGLLAAAMEIPEIATKFREQNARLVPLLLQRLRKLQENSDFLNTSQNPRPFAHFAKSTGNEGKSPHKNGVMSVKRTQDSGDEEIKAHDADDLERVQTKKIKLDHASFASPPHPTRTPVFNESSNSSWVELESYMIGSIQVFPPTDVTRQVLILRYLTPMGEYQELLSHVFEQNALELILRYVNVRETKKARLGFEALKYLAALLCHKKFSIEFIQCKGLEALLDVPRPSIAATGVSICLYYLGYCEEAMERVCLLPKYIVSNLVKYALWLLECSHDSGRCHATMFFGLTFQFKVILDEFDAQDGLRKLHNVISTLPILSGDNPLMNEDSECAARQIVRHVCVAYKRYLEAHLFAKVEQLRRSQIRPSERAGFSGGPQPSYKPFKFSVDEIQQHIETLLNLMPFRTHWAPVDEMLKLGGISSLLKIIAYAYEWNYSGRGEAVRSALDVLAIACVMPKVQLILCEKVDIHDDTVTIGMSIIIGAAEGEIVVDADVQKSALRVMINCVCGPIYRVGGVLARFSAGGTNSPSKKLKVKSSEELIQKMWDNVRSNSGIMVLLQLMNVKTPITDADCIRTLACKALAGMARCDTVKQIVSKLPIIQNGQLQNLMRDPILQEKRQEHVTFQKYALELLERLSGNSTKTNSDTDVSLVNIHRARVVAQTKIQFNDKQLMQLIHQHLMSKGMVDTATTLQKEANLASSLTNLNPQHPSKFRYTSPVTPNRVRLSSYVKESPINRSLSVCNDVQTPTSSNTLQIKIIKKNTSTPSTPQNSRLQKPVSNEPHVKVILPGQQEDINPSDRRITLDSIITEYLTNQHALCKNPMSTCPQFNLFVPHKCPDPKPRIITSNNFAMRSARRQMGYYCKNLDRKLIHTRFCPVQTIRSPSEDSFYTCARFMPGEHSILVGDYSGEVKCFNLHTGDEEVSFQAHDSFIVNLELNRKGDLLLTSSTWGRPLSAMWSVKEHDMEILLQDEDYVEFSKVSQDRLLGTKGGTATIYDVATGQEIQRFIPTISNQYTKNKATFSLNDELVLSDGVLFDVLSGKSIRKLDKLNQTQNGVFHPNGLEIVSNMEVWDLRTFHLLKTVPALNQCSVLFAPVNNAIYAISIEKELEDDTTFDSSFKTIDASDYSSIATFDVKRCIYDLAVNRFDSQIAIVENQGMYHSMQESVIRIYDVGRRKDDEDDQEEEEEEDDDDDMDASDEDGSEGDDGNLLDLTTDNDNNANDTADSDPLDVSWSDLSSDESSVSSSETIEFSSIDLDYDS